MLKRFDKIQEPNAPKLRKPLPAPDDKPKKRRGGKRYRQMKERMGLTDLRKEANRLKFGEDGEEEFRSTGQGFGMLGKAGIGKVKVTAKNNKVKLSNLVYCFFNFSQAKSNRLIFQRTWEVILV
jgi:U4/U6 small nuclear ribonucleoprotein PRP31